MARRRSLNRRWSRRSSVNQSRVLINDSEYIDDEDETYWRHIPDQTKYSAQINSSEPALNPNSEIFNDSDDSEWWKNLQETGQDLDKINKNVNGSTVNESSIKDTVNISISTSASESHQQSRRSKKRRIQLAKNRKTLGRNPFSQILDDTVESEPIPSTSAQYKAMETSSLSLNQLENRRSTRSKTANINFSNYSPESTTSTEPERSVKRRPSIFKRTKRASFLSFSKLLEEDDSIIGPSQSVDAAKINDNVDKRSVSPKNLVPSSPSKNKSTISHKNSEEGGDKTENFETQQRSPYDKLKNKSSRNRTTNIINDSDRDINKQMSHEQENESPDKTSTVNRNQDNNKSLKDTSNDTTDQNVSAQSKVSKSIDNKSSAFNESSKSRLLMIKISDESEDGIYEIENNETEEELPAEPPNESINNSQSDVHDVNLGNDCAIVDLKSASQQSRESTALKNKSTKLEERNNKSNRRVTNHISDDSGDEKDEQGLHKREKGRDKKGIIVNSNQDSNKSLKDKSNDITDRNVSAQPEASQSIGNKSSTLDESHKSRRLTIRISDDSEDGIYEIENNEAEEELTAEPPNESVNKSQSDVHDEDLGNDRAIVNLKSASQQSRESTALKNKSTKLEERNNKSNRRVTYHISYDDSDDENDKQVLHKPEKGPVKKGIIVSSNQESDNSLKDKSNDALDNSRVLRSSKNPTSELDKRRRSSRLLTRHVNDDKSDKNINETENNESEDELIIDARNENQSSVHEENSRNDRAIDRQNSSAQFRKSTASRNKSTKIGDSNKSNRRVTQHSIDNDNQKIDEMIDENESDEDLIDPIDRRSRKSTVDKHTEKNASVDNLKNISTKSKKPLAVNKMVDVEKEIDKKASSELNEDEVIVERRSPTASIGQHSESTKASRSDSDGFYLRLSNDDNESLSNRNKNETENSPKLRKKSLKSRQLKRSSRVFSSSSESIQESFKFKNPNTAENKGNISISKSNKTGIDLEIEKENLGSLNNDLPAIRESESSRKDVSLSDPISHKNTGTTSSRKSSTESLTENFKSTRYRQSEGAAMENRSSKHSEITELPSRQISNEISGVHPLKSSQEIQVSIEDVSNDQHSDTFRNVSLRKRRVIERQTNVTEELDNGLGHKEVEGLKANEDKEKNREAEKHRKAEEKRKAESFEDASADEEERMPGNLSKSIKKRKTDTAKTDLEMKERNFGKESSEDTENRKTMDTNVRNGDEDDKLYLNQQEINGIIYKSKQSVKRINIEESQEDQEEEKGNLDAEMNEDNVDVGIDPVFDPSAYELPEQQRSGSISESDLDNNREATSNVNLTKHETKSKSVSNKSTKKLNESPQPGPSVSKEHNRSTKKSELLDVDAILSSQKMVDLQERLKRIKEKTDKVAEREMKVLEKNSETVMKIFPIFKNVKNRGNLNKNKNTPKPDDRPPTPKPVHRAYIVNGKVYKPPNLPRPQKWATNRLYKYLWKKLEPKYDHRARVKSEKFVVYLSDMVKVIKRRKKYENYKDDLKALLRTMAKLGIIETRIDFHHFCHDFMPFEFRDKVIPRLMPGNVHNIPFHPETLTVPILHSDNTDINRI